MLTTEWTTVLTFSNPLLDALSVEDMHLVAVQACHEVVPLEVAPADWTLLPESTLADSSVLALFLVLSLLSFEFCLV